MRKLIVLAVVSIFMGAPQAASASTYSSEITDMWYIPAESGWGINVILQNNVAFVTFFVYDVNRNPVWYTATLTDVGNFTWTGPLYATSGPWFGGPFPPSGVTVRQAGTATFALQLLNQAALTYTVDGVVVSKTLQRQTWTNEDYTGQYAGGYSILLTGCNASYLNGIQETAGVLSVNQSGASVSIAATTTVGSCSFSGAYTQTGKLGAIQGTYSCTDGTVGNFIAFEMTPTISGFTARIQGNNQYCQWSGYLGGIRRAQ